MMIEDMKKIFKQLKDIKFLVFDFDGVMTDNRVFVDENGKESVICHRGDGLGLELLKKNKDIEIVVMSKEKNKVVAARCKKLNIKTIHGLDDKVTRFKSEVRKRKISFSKACFVGNDVNDIKCMKQAGISIAVADSHPDVLKVADLITSKNGGNGAVREICEWIMGI